MKRSRIENLDLSYNVRINGRITAAFRHYHMAEDFAYLEASHRTTATIEVTDNMKNGDTLLKLLPSEAA